MPTYRVTISLKSPLGTELISGTLWGHLAWAVRYLEGDEALRIWLDEQENNPWLISSQMPVGMVPRPLLKPDSKAGVPSCLAEMQRDKAVRKVAYIPEAIFQRLRQHMSDGSLRAALMEKASVPEADDDGSETFGLRAHNRIDRLSGTTPESGGLFFEEVFFPSHRSRLQLFVATPNPTLERLEELFHFVGQGGFGRNASTGNGYFACAIAEEHSLFATSGSRAMTLSHGVLTENMLNPRYRQHVHFGKLGGDYAKGEYSPFKYPILMVRPGATFDCRGSGPCGAILKGVHHDPDLFHVRHHALHLPLFFAEAKP